MKIKKWLKQNKIELSGKTVVITGSTGGLGKQTCLYLAEMGANFIFLNRNIEKTNELAKELIEKYPSCNIDTIKVDMEDIESVKNACQELNKYKVDYLILNAGTYKIPRKQIGKYDNIFQINFISPYYLVREILTQNNNVKVVAVGSIAHKRVRLKENDINFSSCKNDMKLYGNAKRFLMFSLTQLFKVKNGANLAITHPGITYTNITSHYPKILLPFINFFMKIIFPSTKKASLSIIKGVEENSCYGAWIGPKYFDIWGKPKHKNLKTFSIDEGNKIFEIAEDIYKEL